MAIAAATWVPIDHIGLDQAITATSATQVYATGKKIRARDMSSSSYGEGVFVYAKGVASVIVGDVCIISVGGDAAIRIVARSIGKVGVAMAATVASNWGWWQVEGRGIATAATVLANTQAYASGTAGQIDDLAGVAGAVGDLIYGMKIVGATDTALALVDLSNPYMGDTDNA